jgi:VWFA-related protein
MSLPPGSYSGGREDEATYLRLPVVYNSVMRIRGAGIVFAWGVLQASAALQPFAAQDQAAPRASPSSQAPHHEVTVSLKLLQVYVVDKKGRPVPDLTAADFEITDEGRPVAITDFEFHAAAFPGPTEKAPAAKPPAKLNRKFFLWFDLGFNDPKGVKRAKAAALHFLDTQVRPEDQVAVLSSSGLKGLSVHEYLTTQTVKVRQAVEALTTTRLAGRVAELDFFMEREQPGARFADPGSGSANQEDQAAAALQDQANSFSQEVYKQQAVRFLREFRELAKSLRYVPGTKSLVLFSGGIARSLLFGMKRPTKQFNPYGSPEEQADFNEAVLNPNGDRDVQAEYTALVQELKAANAFIYAVNETAVVNRNTDSAHGDFDIGDVLGDEFLRRLSAETGGRYYHNTEDTGQAVEDIQNFTASYYVLGYPVSAQWDGRFHAVQVKLRKPDLQCWGTAGYFNPKPFAEYSAAEKRLHLVDLVLSEEPQGSAPAEIPVLAAAAYAEGGPRLVVLARVPSEPGEADFGPKTEAILALFDEQKSVKGIKRADLALTAKDGGRAILSGVLPVPPGRYTLRLVLRDLDSGRSARAAAEVNVPAPAFAALTTGPPLWLAAGGGMEWRDVFSKEALTGLYPFSRAAFRPLLEGARPGTTEIFAVLPVSFYGTVRPEIRFSAQLLTTAAGTSRTISLAVLEKTESPNRDFYLLKLKTDPLPPGGYSIYLFIQDKSGYKKAFVSPLAIR